MRPVRALLAASLVAVLFARQVCAAGFELDEQDVELLGAAFAGRAAWSHNASAAWWNPASMSGLPKGWNSSVGLCAVLLEQKFRDEGSTSAAGTAMLGNPTPDGGENGFVPSIYLTRSFGEEWVAGLAVNVPFGLSTNYSTDSTVRYFATKSELTVLNIEPVVSYRITDHWSIGGGVNIEYADATLANQIDFGSIGAGIPGLAPQMNDGSVKIEGDSWAVGWTLGVHLRLNERHRLGLSYRSRVNHDLGGAANFTVPTEAQPIVGATGAFVDSGIDARLALPAKFVFSGAHQVAKKWTFLWDVSWTDWRPLDALNIRFDNPNQPTSTLVLDWKDTWRFSAGGSYAATDRWSLRAGVAWDQSPIPSTTRGPRLPGTDRWWIALGVSYRIREKAYLHFGYAHIFTDRVGIDQSSPTAGHLLGSVQGRGDILGVGVTWNF